MLDFYQVSQLFTPEERQVQATAREFLDSEAVPHIRDWWEQDAFPVHLVPRLGELGLIGSNLAVPGGTETVSNAAYGLIMYELERVDSAWPPAEARER